LIKGMDPRQKILALPSARLDTAGSEVPALIGASMASSARLKEGDYVTLRWRDTHGAFDAMEIRIAGVFNTNVPSVDAGQVWLPLEALRHMTLMPGEATLLVSSETFQRSDTLTGWVFKNQKFLLSDFDKIIQSKKASGSILWGILILLAMLAVFDTQVLSIFRRQKEIGTYVAMGMTRGQVVALFTVEGAMHSVLAAIVGAVYGIPFLVYEAIHGLSMPGSTKDFGISMASTIYPVYSVGLVITTVLLILITTVIVSYWPARKIAKMNPTDALRGKIQ